MALPKIPVLFEQHARKLAAKDDHPLVVGLELPPDALDDARKEALSCGGNAGCGSGLSQSPFWARSRDGRSSQANFRLIADLVRLEAGGEIRLLAFDLRGRNPEPFGEMAMSTLLPAIGRANALILTGNSHARLDGSGNSVASALQDHGHRVASLVFYAAQGTAWACSGGTCGIFPVSTRVCGPAEPPMPRIGEEREVCLPWFTASEPLVP